MNSYEFPKSQKNVVESKSTTFLDSFITSSKFLQTI
jgi:hypothetical protein